MGFNTVFKELKAQYAHVTSLNPYPANVENMVSS